MASCVRRLWIRCMWSSLCTTVQKALSVRAHPMPATMSSGLILVDTGPTVNWLWRAHPNILQHTQCHSLIRVSLGRTVSTRAMKSTEHASRIRVRQALFSTWKQCFDPSSTVRCELQAHGSSNAFGTLHSSLQRRYWLLPAQDHASRAHGLFHASLPKQLFLQAGRERQGAWCALCSSVGKGTDENALFLLTHTHNREKLILCRTPRWQTCWFPCVPRPRRAIQSASILSPPVRSSIILWPERLPTRPPSPLWFKSKVKNSMSTWPVRRQVVAHDFEDWFLYRFVLKMDRILGCLLSAAFRSWPMVR